MSPSPGKGLIIAAPASGSGKTTVTLGLLRALYRRGVAVSAAKSGPDYIDPRFHAAACKSDCVNLDAWAMPAERIQDLASGHQALVIEGAMGLFDGAPPKGDGSVADLARSLQLPVVLVVDASHMAQSVAPAVSGFAGHDAGVDVVGVILNKVGSKRHETMLRNALRTIGIPVLGAVMRDLLLEMPSRHLGLVQAAEHPDLERFLDHAGHVVENAVDLAVLQDLMRPLPAAPETETKPPRRQGVLAIAQDEAFNFIYPHQLTDWAAEGWDIQTFSPLADDEVPDADRVFLPGGYPELHAGKLAKAKTFLDSLRSVGETADIYGECGGYMVLGETLVDAEGVKHKMAGLLPLETSFAERKLHLGYRQLEAEHGPMTGQFRGHEFHYATTLAAEGESLFQAKDAEGNELEPMGLRKGRICGSFAHVIDRRL